MGNQDGNDKLLSKTSIWGCINHIKYLCIKTMFLADIFSYKITVCNTSKYASSSKNALQNVKEKAKSSYIALQLFKADTS